MLYRTVPRCFVKRTWNCSFITSILDNNFQRNETVLLFHSYARKVGGETQPLVMHYFLRRVKILLSGYCEQGSCMIPRSQRLKIVHRSLRSSPMQAVLLLRLRNSINRALSFWRQYRFLDWIRKAYFDIASIPSLLITALTSVLQQDETSSHFLAHDVCSNVLWVNSWGRVYRTRDIQSLSTWREWLFSLELPEMTSVQQGTLEYSRSQGSVTWN